MVNAGTHKSLNVLEINSKCQKNQKHKTLIKVIEFSCCCNSLVVKVTFHFGVGNKPSTDTASHLLFLIVTFNLRLQIHLFSAHWWPFSPVVDTIDQSELW